MTRMPLICFAFLFLCGTAPAGTITLKGRVVTGSADKPVVGRAVQVEHHENRNADMPDSFVVRTHTDEEGLFSIDISRSGDEEFMLFVPSESGQPMVGYTHLKKSRDFGTIPLGQDGILCGKVWGPDDRPVCGAGVAVEMRLDARCDHYLEALTAQTDKDGMFEIKGLNEGTYRCSVASPEHTSGRNEIEVTDDFSYLELCVEQAATISGRVIDGEGKPVAGAVVSAGRRRSATTDEKGAFLLGGLDESDYHLRVSAEGYAPKNNKVTTVKVKAGKTAERDITVLPTGSLLLALNPEKDGVSVPSEVTASLSVRGEWQSGYRHLTVPVKDGKALFNDVACGAYSVQLEGSQFGDSSAPVKIESGEEATAILLLLKTVPFAGRVVDEFGVPVEGANVIAGIGKREGGYTSPSSFEYESTDAEGKFGFAGLGEGTIEIRIHTEEALPFSEKIQLTEGGETNREFVLSKGISISGKVVDEGGKPAFGAEVSIEQPRDMHDPFSWGSDEKDVETDSEGRFSVDGLLAGGALLKIEHSDMIPLTKNIEISANAKPETLYVLKKGLTLVGKVVDRDGLPISEADVEVTIEDKGSDESYGKNAETGDDGSFRIAGLPAGSVDVAIEAEEFSPLTQEVVIEKEMDAETTFKLEDGLVISGSIEEPDGSLVEGLSMRVWGPSGPNSHTHISKNPDISDDGAFEVAGLARGKYTISFLDSESGRTVHSLSDVEAGAEWALIILGARKTLTVQAVGPDGEPVGGAEVTIQRKDDSNSFRMYSSRGSDMTTDSQGRFQTEVREGSKYEVTLRKRPLLDAKRILDLTGGAEELLPDPVEMQLETGNMIKGVVVNSKDGSPVIGAFVRGGRSAGPWGMHMNSFGDDDDETGERTDDEGRFVADGLPAGVVTLTVHEDAEGKTVLATKKVSVVKGKKTEEVRIEIDEAGSISGAVVDKDGKPVSRCTVMLYSPDSPTEQKHEQAGVDGSFLFERVAPGRYMLMHFMMTRRRPKFSMPSPVSVVVEAGKETTTTLGGKEVGDSALKGSTKLRGVPFASGKISFMPYTDGKQNMGNMFGMYAGVRQANIATNGSYEVKGISPGVHIVRIEKEAEEWAARAQFVGKINILEDQKTLDIDISGATLGGAVNGPDGVPAESVRVTATQEGAGIMHRHLLARMALTEEDGSFHIENMAPGVYDITIQDNELGQASRRGVQIGKEDVQIQIGLGESVTLTGTVSSSGDATPEGAMVFAFSGDMTMGGTGMVSSDGTYELSSRLAPGKYSVFVMLSGYSLAATELDIQDDTTFDPVLVAAGDLDVTLTGSSDAIKGRIIHVKDGEGKEVVRIRSAEYAMVPMMGTCVLAPTDETGETTVRGLPPGKYRVTVEGTDASAEVEITALETGAVTVDI